MLRYLATPAPTHPLLLSQIVLLPCMTLQHVSLLELRFWKVFVEGIVVLFCLFCFVLQEGGTFGLGVLEEEDSFCICIFFF